MILTAFCNLVIANLDIYTVFSTILYLLFGAVIDVAVDHANI
jgi:hypothetical protein